MRGWPAALEVVRHGESVGNVARDHAEGAGLEVIDVATRDADVGLTALGHRQAEALGRSLRDRPRQEQPTVVLSSTYRRAADTAAVALRAAGLELPVLLDERLRDRDFGVLDRLTWLGISRQHPEEAERRRWLGKFAHRPAGGESWQDVAQRLRAVLGDLRSDLAGERVLMVTHDVVVLLVRYVVEGMTEQQVLELQRRERVLNGALTAFRYDEGTRALRLHAFNQALYEGRPVEAGEVGEGLPLQEPAA